MLKTLVPGSAPAPARLRSGFTLTELMVASVAMGFVLAYSLGAFTANRNTYAVIDNVSEAHQNIMAISGLIERDIRNAGYMVPPATAACGIDSSTSPDLLFVSDAEAILPADSLPALLAGSNLSATPSAGALPGTWPAAIDLDDVIIDETATYDTDATPGPDSDFRPNGGAIFANLADPGAGVWCGIVTAVDAASNQITVDLSTGTAPPTAGNWAIVPAHVYRIVAGALLRDGVLMARNAEDIQLAWFYDLDDDGQVDAGENLGSGVGGPDLDTTDIGGVGADPGLLREIRLNLVLRTAQDDPTDPTSAGIGQTRENQTNAAAADGRRRRVHTATIRLRNLTT